MLNQNSSFLLDITNNFSFIISKRLYHTSFKLNIVNFLLAFQLGSPLNPMKDWHCLPEPQLHFISQFMQMQSFFPFLANALYKLPKTGSKMPFITHFYSLLINTCTQNQISYFETIQMFGNMIVLSEFWGSGCRCEDLMLLQEQMLISPNVK